jgi:hypothetical protein
VADVNFFPDISGGRLKCAAAASTPAQFARANLRLPSRGALDVMAQALRQSQPDFALEDAAVQVVFPDISDGWLERTAAALQTGRQRGSSRGRHGSCAAADATVPSA